MSKINKISFILILLASLYAKSAFCGVSEEFKEKVKNLKWVAYAPTHFDPTRDVYPSEDSLRGDLALLYQYGFNGIVTYGAQETLAKIPRLAVEAGFRGVIMGIWDIENREEMMNAILASEYVDGYCLGNEGLNCRYDLDSLNSVISNIKESTHKPATTTEQIFDYANDNVFSIGDWIFPNIHPFLSKVRQPKEAADWIEKHYQRLKKHCPTDKIILFKETGYPTAGDPQATESNQMEFFLNLEKIGIPYVYFEAFDQRWKTDLSVEPHWGLFYANRKPKKYIASVFYRSGKNR
jgi:exo-beta-1,3-glucanase (GH17 family)